MNSDEEFVSINRVITMKTFIRIFFLLVVLFSATHSIRAATIVWTNTAGGDWSVAANWNPNQVPDTSDTAVIATEGDYTVTLDVSTTVGGLVLGTTSGSGSQTFLINGQTFTLNGETVVNSNGQFILNGGPITFSGILTNYGTVIWTNTDLKGYTNVQIFNYGLWDAKTDNTFSLSWNGNGPLLFNNYGVFRKSGCQGGATYINYPVQFNNTGIIEMQAGWMLIAEGTGGGTYNVADNTGIYFNNYTLTGQVTFAGTGWIQGHLNGDHVVLNGIVNTFDLSMWGSTWTIASNTVVNFLPLPGYSSGAGFTDLLLTNYGTVNWAGIDLSGWNNAQIFNYGLWDAKTNSSFSGLALFNNYGVFRKSGGLWGGVTYISDPFNNAGTVEVQKGWLEVRGGAGGGVFNTTDNTGIEFDHYTLTGQVTFAGTGYIEGYLNGDLAVLNGVVSIIYFSMLSGTMTIASNTVVNFTQIPGVVSSERPCFNNLLLTNYGTVNWAGTDLAGWNNPQIFNYGLWDAKTNNSFSYTGPGSLLFNNYGVFRKSGSQGGVTYINNNVQFNNTGTVEVQAGWMEIWGGAGGGTYNVADNTGISFFTFSGYTLTGQVTFAGSGRIQGYRLNGDHAVLNGCVNFVSPTSLSGTMTIASNTVVNLGSVSGTPSSFTVDFSNLLLTNFGTVNWTNTDLSGYNNAQIFNYGLWDVKTDNSFSRGSNDSLLFNNYGVFRKSGGQGGATYINNPIQFNNPGTIDVQAGALAIFGGYTLAGGTLNFGINSSNNFGCLSFAGDAALTGTVSANLNNNYVPVAGASFPVLAYGSASGVFTSVKLPAGLAWETDYGLANFTLSVSNVLPAQLSVTQVGNNNLAFTWYAIPGQTYQIQYTTNLAPVNWINLGDPIFVTNTTTTASDVIKPDPQRFYRAVLQ
jgi:hypothetical protein